jgi:CCR4-NOT transcription complex subunit 2
VSQYMRNAQSSPPRDLANGTSTPSTNPQAPSEFGRGTSDSYREMERDLPVTRPVQQILQSPVDKWGLKALLYEIKAHMGKDDRGMVMFGEDLEELGMNIQSEE